MYTKNGINPHNFINKHFLILRNFFHTHYSSLLLGTINQVQCICVLESDFGFALNCNFKNAGMFRIRNLGGLKAHIGLGRFWELSFNNLFNIYP